MLVGVEEDFVNGPLHDGEGEVAEKHNEENYDRGQTMKKAGWKILGPKTWPCSGS